jgi:hypothetical protein
MELPDSFVVKQWPRQKLLRTQKNSKWGEMCVDAIVRHCRNVQDKRRSPIQQKRRNYNLLNNKINRADFEYTLNPFNLSKERLNEFQLPASLQPYDVVSPTFMLLFGEEAKRMFNPIVRGINEGVIHSKQQQKQQMIMQILDSTLKARLGIDPEAEEPPLEQIEKYLNYSPKDMRESVMEKLLTYYRKKLNLHNTFQIGWKDSLVAGEEIYRVEKIGDGPRVTRVNPLNIAYILPTNSDFIDDADMIHELEYLTLPQIIDNFFEHLTEAQVTYLEEHFADFTPNPYSMTNYYTIPEVESIFQFTSKDNMKGIPVNRVRWKSFRKMGYWNYMNPETGEIMRDLVNEDFQIDKNDPTQFVEWFWINEYWEGVRIGEETSGIYINIKPCDIQYRTLENPTVCKSGYVGTLYNSLNSQSVSLMDRLVPWIYLYMIIWYNTELLISTNMGKIATIDTSLIPPGWEPEKWFMYIKSMKIAFVNSYNEGKKAERYGDVNSSTQTKALDMELGNSIQYNIQLLEFIEQKIEMTSGITRQRKGAISASELVGNTERAVVQSSHITEEWFRVHNYTKVRVCEALLEVAKICLQDGGNKVMQYITDDLADVLFAVDGGDLEIDHAVFVTDMAKDYEALQAFKDNLRFALQADKIDFSQIVDVYNSESIADLKAKTKQVEQERAQREQEQLQVQQQMQQEQLDRQEKMEMMKLEMQKYIADTNNATKIAVAEMSTYIGAENMDVDGNGIPDPMQIGELALKQQELASKEMNDRLKLKVEKAIKDKEIDIKTKELQLKEKEIASKESLEREKLKVEKENMKNDLQIARINAKNKPKPSSKK